MMYGMKTNIIPTLIFLIIIAFSFTGCANQESDTPETISAPAEEETLSLTLQSEITVPSYLNGTETDALPVLEKKEAAITYKLSEQQQTDIVALLTTQIEDSIAQVLADKQYYPSITDIMYNHDCTEFNVIFSDIPSLYETTLRMSLYIAGDKLQLYLGKPAEELLTVVNYIDASTGEVFFTGSSADISKE